jgi:hypothetical protein
MGIAPLPLYRPLTLSRSITLPMSLRSLAHSIKRLRTLYPPSSPPPRRSSSISGTMPHHHSNTYSLSSAHPPFFFNANPNHLPGVDDSPPLVDHLAVPLGWDGAASDALNSFAQSPLETTSSSTATTPNTQMIDTAFQSLDLLSPPPQDTYFGFPFAYSDVDDNQYFLSNYTSLPEHQVAKSEPLPLSTLLYEDIVASPVCSIPSTPIVPASSVAEVSLTSPQADLSDVSSSDSHTSSSFDSCTIRPSSLPTRWTSEAPRPPLTRRAYSQRSDGPTIRRRSFNNHTVLPVSNIFWNSTKFEVDAQLGSPSAQLRWIVSSATAAAAPKLATIDGQSSDENAPTRKRKRQPSSGEVEPASGTYLGLDLLSKSPHLIFSLDVIAATAPQKSVLHPPKLAPSTWQIFFTEQLQLIKLKSPDQKLNVAHAAKDLAQVYKNMSAEEKEVGLQIWSGRVACHN